MKILSFFAKNKADEKAEQVISSARELSDDEINHLVLSQNQISKLKTLNETDYLLKRNYFDFLNFIDNLNRNPEHFCDNEINTYRKMQNCLQETNRLLTNVLFSFSATVEHFKRNLETEDIKEYNKMLSELYDTCPEYAFIYKLRNFSQHQTLPIKNMNVEDSINKGTKVKIHLSKKDLLKYDSWGQVAKPFLIKQPETFDITNILVHAVTELNNTIFIFWINKYIDSSQQHFDIIVDFISEIIEYARKNNYESPYPCILEKLEHISEDKKNLNMSISYFPIDFLSELGIIKIKDK